MLAYAQNFPPNHTYSADICIVGAGAAGITLAHKLLQMKTGKRILLIESANLDQFGLMTDAHRDILQEYGTYPPEVMAKAGLDADAHRGYDPVAQQLYEGVESRPMRDIDPIFLTRSRLRAYGGTTNCWGGWTRPLSHIDFQRSDLGLPWPIRGEVLYQGGYYDEAMKYCSLPPIGVDRYNQQDFWLVVLPNLIEFMNLQQAGGRLANAPFLVINGQRLDFQTVWGPDLEAAAANDCTVLRNANIRFAGRSDDGRSVEYLFGSTIENDARGRDFTVRAGRFVLATGGIEVARLLLWSATRPEGFNSRNDNLGRYFQVHPLNASYASFRPGPNRPTAKMVQLYERQTTVPIGDYPAQLFASLVPADRTLVDLKLRNFRARISFSGNVNMNWEQAPNAGSRVWLSTERDRFWGDPLTQLDWQPLPVDTQTVEVGLGLVAEAMERLGYGNTFRHIGETITAPGDHHMGTTRMALNAREGYVDPNCQVFGATNLFIASSAVFTTSGYANPTLTIVALAARLADHLGGKQA